MRPYRLYHVVAVSKGGVIGKANRLPWHFSSDLRHFKELTLGSTVILGRKTFEGLGKRPLAGRENFVLTHTPGRDDGPLKFFTSLEAALEAISTPRAFIMGGASLYRETLNLIDGIYVTKIDADYEGDTCYPPVPAEFQEQREKRKLLQENPKIEALYLERFPPLS